MNKFDNAYNQIVSEDESLDRWNQQQIEKEKEYNGADNNEPKEKLTVDDIFEVYEEIGMSAEMGIDDLFTSTMQQIEREVPKPHQRMAAIAVRKLWRDKINDFMRSDWTNNPVQP
jgi:hypothetical protein